MHRKGGSGWEFSAFHAFSAVKSPRYGLCVSDVLCG